MGEASAATERQACPECDSLMVSQNKRDSPRGPTAGSRYYCRGCNAHFDDPARRTRTRSKSDRTPSARVNALLDADPSEVP